MNISKNQMIQLISVYNSQKKSPFVVEVLGTPNSGKTTALQTFEKLLKRNGIRGKIIYEAAGRCKINNKFSPEFNLWTLNETIKQLVEAYTANYDIIVCERGLLDTLCWFNIYYQDKLISKQEYDKIVEYTLLKGFVNRIDYELIMSCNVETSLYREHLTDINEATGTIVNNVVLTKYNSSLQKVKKDFDKNFKKLIEIDTTNLSQQEINKLVITKIFELMKLTVEGSQSVDTFMNED